MELHNSSWEKTHVHHATLSSIRHRWLRLSEPALQRRMHLLVHRSTTRSVALLPVRLTGRLGSRTQGARLSHRADRHETDQHRLGGATRWLPSLPCQSTSEGWLRGSQATL